MKADYLLIDSTVVVINLTGREDITFFISLKL